MATLQVSRLAASPAAPTLQVARTEASVSSVAGSLKLQIARLEVALAAMAGVPVVTAGPVTPTTAEPFETVTMEVAVTGTYTSVNWVQQAGSGADPISLAGSDLVKSFSAPALLTQTTVRWAVNATGPNGTSDPVIVTVTIKPQVAWYLNSALVWVPDRSLAP